MYRVVTYNEALEQIAALPAEALVFYAEGTTTYLILEQQREVHVLLVQWAG